MSETQIEASRRASVDMHLGRAAAALESAAREMAELKRVGIEYATRTDGDPLDYVQALSRWVLDLQVKVRAENHQPGESARQ
jgi:hypothetical protein